MSHTNAKLLFFIYMHENYPQSNWDHSRQRKQKRAPHHVILLVDMRMAFCIMATLTNPDVYQLTDVTANKHNCPFMVLIRRPKEKCLEEHNLLPKPSAKSNYCRWIVWGNKQRLSKMKYNGPWPVRLSCLSIVPRTNRAPFRFLVRARRGCRLHP